ncbi:MAG: ATP-binding protein [Proteobacteria bacterium]|nr:ATP-binding protein [Pseudomonadota bacterium]
MTKQPPVLFNPTLAFSQYQTIWEMNFPHLLQSYCYSFKTPPDAKQLAHYLSSFYPLATQHLIELGLNELFLNAIEHGHLGIDYALKSHLKKTQQWENEIYERLKQQEHQYKSVDVLLEINPAYILLKIRDQGEGFNWLHHNTKLDAPSFELCGRGLILVKELCFDKVEFSKKGNEISCFRYL